MGEMREMRETKCSGGESNQISAARAWARQAGGGLGINGTRCKGFGG